MKHGFIAIGQPFLSSYTGDVEQLMEYSPEHASQFAPIPLVEINEYSFSNHQQIAKHNCIA
jgi:hypothetical protein